MGKVRVAFKIVPNREKGPMGFEKIGCHLIIYIKMENFQYKAVMVGNINENRNSSQLNLCIKYHIFILPRATGHIPVVWVRLIAYTKLQHPQKGTRQAY